MLVSWTLVTFTLLEHVMPAHGTRPSWRQIAVAAGLLAIDAAIARALAPAVSAASPARIAGAWLLAELGLYCVHRAMHRVPLLWRFHRLHHEAAPLAWATAWRSHPIDALAFGAVVLVASVIAGAPLPAATWFVVGRRMWTVVLHANLAWPASWLDAVIATPPFHRRHHREDLPPGNFAGTLPWIDALFGTRV